MTGSKKGLTSSQKQLIAICVVVYFVSYLTRKNYSSVLANIRTGFAGKKAKPPQKFSKKQDRFLRNSTSESW